MPPEPYIRILNPGPTDVLIQRVRVRPTIYGVAKDYSRRGRQAFFEGADVNVLLRPGQEHELPIIDLRNEENKNVSQRVCFCIYWRKTSSNWLPQAPVTVRSSTRVIEQIVAATPQQD
jgi:hypothetical protein